MDALTRFSARQPYPDSLFSRDTCVTCDGTTPTCDCASDEQCVLTSRTCSQCPTIQCNKIGSSSGSSINPGVIAGPIVAVLVIASCALFWWLRRKKKRDLARLEELAARARKAESAGFHLSQPGSPSPGSARSARSGPSGQSLPAPPPSARRSSQRSPLPPAPVNAEYYDENGTTIRVYTGNGTINLDPKHRRDPSNGSDPFADRQSVSTAGSRGTSTQSTNIIPIQYIPPSKSDDTLTRFFHTSREGGNGGADQPLSQAARTLDEARQNLFRPKGGQPPQRPARAPGLDLRAPEDGRTSPFDDRTPISAQNNGQSRDSYLSGNSTAPSFLSGATDLYADAPRIMTSKQVQIGRLQHAEVVQFGKQGADVVTHGQERLSPGYSPFDRDDAGANVGPSRVSPALSAVQSPQEGLSVNTRTLTPTSRLFGDDEEGIENDEPSPSSSGDLRFSMGSLAYRDSVSSMGTSRFLARPDSAAVPPPKSPGGQAVLGHAPRESMASGKSFADSVLGAFPMIPPGHQHELPPGMPGGGIGIPQSSSVASLDAQARMPRPPTSFKPVTGSGGAPSLPHPRERTGPTPARPETTASVADSFLGTFPFVPPNMDDLAELPSAALPTAAVPETASRSAATGGTGTGAGTGGNGGAGGEKGKAGRLTLGMSTTSEGLGAFDFSFDRNEAPPLPTQGPSSVEERESREG